MQNDSGYKELKRTTIIIAIANLGSKAISFILAPLYSYFLTVEEYGTMDLVTTTSSLIVPIICFDIFEATFRFSCDKKLNRSEILSTSLAACMLSLLCLVALCIGCLFHPIANSTAIIGAGVYIAISTFVMVLSQYNRGIGKMRIFAYGGVVNAFFLLLSNIVFMLVLHKGLYGWIISFVLGKTAQLVFLFLNTDMSIFSVRNMKISVFNTMLKYCIPLLPTQIMWWVMNASDRYVLATLAGTTAIGLYSVGNKIPHLLSLFENIFYQSWQTSAISNANSKERDQFYSVVFNNYFAILCVGVQALLIVCKPAINILWEKSYEEAWYCVAPLILGVLVHALGGNLGSFYAVFKETKGALYTSLVGAVTNIILNLIFIPVFGYIAAAVTTLIGYSVTLIIRWYDVKKYVKLHLDIRKAILYVTLIGIQTLLYYINTPVSYSLRILILLCVVCNERKTIIQIIKK